MIFLLDTSAISDAMAEDSATLAQMELARLRDQVVTCTVVRGEILFGINRLAAGRRRSNLESKAGATFRKIRCEGVPESAADTYAEIKLNRLAAGISLADNDLWIAATALAIDARLVTRDSDFNGIEGLIIENWSKP